VHNREGIGKVDWGQDVDSILVVDILAVVGIDRSFAVAVVADSSLDTRLGIQNHQGVAEMDYPVLVVGSDLAEGV
jgi:hypothetical protein